MNKYLSTDVDDMDYDDVIKKDKRNFGEYFCDKLKTIQIILHIFYHKDPLIPMIIKIFLFILNIDLYLFICGLFFNEDYVSKVFRINGNESFNDFITRCMDNFLYPTLIGIIIDYFIQLFFIDEKKFKVF